ncbi:MAG: hypothetical protein ABEH88_01715 [Halobacteriales archaeon]
MGDAPNAAGPSSQEDAETESDTSHTVEATDEAEISDRDVVVPLPLYKVVTVFSTLIAGAAVVGGFIVLDEATQRASVPVEDIDPLLSLLGLFMIAGGGALYAFSGRFRAPGMGTTNTDEDEKENNG